MSNDYEALQSALAGQHGVIWAYGTIGAQVDDDLLALVSVAEQKHRERRHQIEQLILSAGLQPVASAPAYTLAQPVTDTSSAVELAAGLEDSMAKQWRYCLGRFDEATLRERFAEYLSDCAVSAYSWRRLVYGTAAPTMAFPGE